jgi:hypothetical protein
MFRYGVGAGAVVAKRRRLADGRGLVGQELWHHGLVPLLRSLRRLQGLRAAAALSRSAGFVVGLWLGHRAQLVGELFTL